VIPTTIRRREDETPFEGRRSETETLNAPTEQIRRRCGALSGGRPRISIEGRRPIRIILTADPLGTAGYGR
jgi:hypothetical protein